jgi:predicted NUDIX family phosphoesterase
MTQLSDNKIITPPAWLNFKKEEEEKPEEILVFPSELLVNFEFKDGFCEDLTHFDEILEQAQFMTRNMVENDTSLIQIISYSVIECNEHILTYQRQGETESRLDGKMCVGIGGHINPIDALVSNRLAPYNASSREIYEETGINNPRLYELMGLIFDDAEEVGKVHLGVLFSVLLVYKPIIQKPFFWKRSIELYKEQYEVWSEIALNSIYPCYMNIGKRAKSSAKA